MKRATWAWAETKDAESWTGFATRAAAVAYGRRHLRIEETAGFIAPCIWPDPATIAMNVLDADELLERMDEWASEDAFFSEDPLFELCGRGPGLGALARAIGSWAKRHVRATQYTVDSEKAEAVT